MSVNPKFHRAAGVLALAVSSLVAAAPNPNDATWQAILRDPSTADAQPILLDATLAKRSNASLADDTLLQLDLGRGHRVEAMRLRSHVTSDGVEVWQGLVTDTADLASGATEIADDPLNSAILVRNGSKITGSVRVEGQLYRILPLHDGTQVAVKVDESRMPPDHPHTYAGGSLSLPDRPLGFRAPRWSWAAGSRDRLRHEETFGEIDALGTGPTAVAKANTVIRVMVVATQAAATASGDLTGLINLAITESNRGYTNSGVQITLQLAGLYTTTYAESGSFSTDLSRFRGTSDGYMDNIHSLRNQNTADVAMIVLNNSSSCGLASAIGATASTAFASVSRTCTTGYYSFAHEIGHLQSARHDPANDPTNTPYAYGHGYQSPTKAWRTVMAYNCSPSCPRINYWSSPLRTYGGQAMGTTTRSDNARALNNTRATIAGFR
jgi:hypothetical protein